MARLRPLRSTEVAARDLRFADAVELEHPPLPAPMAAADALGVADLLRVVEISDRGWHFSVETDGIEVGRLASVPGAHWIWRARSGAGGYAATRGEALAALARAWGR